MCGRYATYGPVSRKNRERIEFRILAGQGRRCADRKLYDHHD